MYGLTAQVQTIEVILKRYATHLQACRDRIIADLMKSPRTAVLTGYFQEGKRFRALLSFVAASAIGIDSRRMIPMASPLNCCTERRLFMMILWTRQRRDAAFLHSMYG